MTPLAAMFAKELAMPLSKRVLVDAADVGRAIGSDLHCFDVTAVANHIESAIDHPDFWRDAQSMAGDMFLPSPLTWLEFSEGENRTAYMIEDKGDGVFDVSAAISEVHEYGGSTPVETFRIKSILEQGERIEITTDRIAAKVSEGDESAFDLVSLSYIKDVIPTPETLKKMELVRDLAESRLSVVQDRIARCTLSLYFMEHDVVKRRIAFIIFALSLINTPGIVGMKQHAAHKGLQRQLNNIGKYPLRGWSEIVLKHHTIYAGEDSHSTGPAFHKCLHFVRSHLRRLHSGKTIVIPAHWRGDPALGIKQTRYKVAA